MESSEGAGVKGEGMDLAVGLVAARARCLPFGGILVALCYDRRSIGGVRAGWSSDGGNVDHVDAHGQRFREPGGLSDMFVRAEQVKAP